MSGHQPVRRGLGRGLGSLIPTAPPEPAPSVDPASDALYVQNTQGVRQARPVDPAFVRDQILAVFDDLGVDGLELAALLSDVDAYADELLSALAGRLGFADAYERVVDALVQ